MGDQACHFSNHSLTRALPCCPHICNNYHPKESHTLRCKKAVFLSLVFFILLIIFSGNIHAITHTWSGGTDTLASNPANWSLGMVPMNGDDVVFDSTSSSNCSWDIGGVRLSSLSLKSGYEGKVTVDTTFTIAKSTVWTGRGADNLASNTSNWVDGILPKNGDNIVFDSTSAKESTWDINVIPGSLKLDSGYTGKVTLNLPLSITGGLTIAEGLLDLNNKNLTVDGYILIDIDGTLLATSSTITLKGFWINAGSFSPGQSTVVLAGTNQAIYGSNTFYNLVKTASTSDTLYFEAGSTQTILNSLTLQGADGNLLSLRSTLSGSFWYIDPQGTRNVLFVDIRDLYNRSFTSIVTLNSQDSGNNNGVSFGGSECVCLSPLWQRGERGDFIDSPRGLLLVEERG